MRRMRLLKPCRKLETSTPIARAFGIHHQTPLSFRSLRQPEIDISTHFGIGIKSEKLCERSERCLVDKGFDDQGFRPYQHD
jgi:hypothetical protein